MTWICPETGKKFQTGATPTPKNRLMAVVPFMSLAAPPERIAYVPKYRSAYGNDRYGDCVTAEEAFAKSCYGYNIPDDVVIDWCRSHGVLNGANLEDVLSKMKAKGFQVGSQLYNDGAYYGVDYEDETVLKAAVATGPVKIAIAAGALPGGAGSRDGWFSLSTNNRRTDHSVTICGYGLADWLYQQLGMPVPSGLPATQPGYLLYTWGTIGFVAHKWVTGTTDEAWVRDPTNVGVPPLTPPTPPTPPFAPPLVGSLFAEQVGPVIAIRGEVQLTVGSSAFTYIATPDGAGKYRFVPKPVL